MFGVEDYESNDLHDASFHCSGVDWSDDSDEEDIIDDSVPRPAQERKFIVFESSLDQLIGKINCLICGKPQSDIKKFLLGSMLRVRTECLDCHTTMLTWNSQPLIGHMPSGNLLCTAATLFSGETFQHMNFVDFLRLEYVDKTTYFEIQREILLPVDDTAVQSHRKF